MATKPSFLGTSFMVVAALLCTGCNNGSGRSQGHVPPTATRSVAGPTSTIAALPTVNVNLGNLPVHSITFASIGFNERYDDVQGTADGFLFLLQQSTGDTAPFVGKLYYYRYATHQAQLIDTSQPQPAGNNRNIRLITTAGGYVAYIKSDNNLENWELWLTNLTTGEHILLDSPAQTPMTQYPSNFAFDGQHLVWASLTPHNNQLGSIIRVYSIQQRTTQTIFTDDTSTPPNIYRPAIFGDTITYTKLPLGATDATIETIWRMNLDGSNRQQIATTKNASVNMQMDGAYVVWDELNEPSANTIHVIDLRTNQTVPIPFNYCVRPLLFNHYLSCVNIDTTLYFEDLALGKYSALPLAAPYVSMTSDRVIWADDDEKNVVWVMYPTP